MVDSTKCGGDDGAAAAGGVAPAAGGGSRPTCVAPESHACPDGSCVVEATLCAAPAAPGGIPAATPKSDCEKRFPSGHWDSMTCCENKMACETVCAEIGANWDQAQGTCTVAGFVFQMALLGRSTAIWKTQESAIDSRLKVSVEEGVANTLGVNRESVVMIGVETKFTRRRLQARALGEPIAPGSEAPATAIKSGETWLLFKIKVAGTDANLIRQWELAVSDKLTFGMHCIQRINDALGMNWAELGANPITSVVNVGDAETKAFADGATRTADQSKYGNDPRFAAANAEPSAAEKANDEFLPPGDPDAGKSAEQIALQRAVEGAGTDPFCYNEETDKYVLLRPVICGREGNGCQKWLLATASICSQPPCWQRRPLNPKPPPATRPSFLLLCPLCSLSLLRSAPHTLHSFGGPRPPHSLRS